ncbi:MAG: hypothetical protein KDD60_09135, partial [Bdellovibrionales bacterium]|nr:hypothetical protein [Bdellovibrionales bacterium]
IDQDKKSGHPPDFLICVADRLKEWLAERRNLDRGDQQGIFYLVETKDEMTNYESLRDLHRFSCS